MLISTHGHNIISQRTSRLKNHDYHNYHQLLFRQRSKNVTTPLTHTLTHTHTLSHTHILSLSAGLQRCIRSHHQTESRLTENVLRVSPISGAAHTPGSYSSWNLGSLLISRGGSASCRLQGLNPSDRATRLSLLSKVPPSKGHTEPSR